MAISPRLATSTLRNMPATSSGRRIYEAARYLDPARSRPVCLCPLPAAHALSAASEFHTRSQDVEPTTTAFTLFPVCNIAQLAESDFLIQALGFGDQLPGRGVRRPGRSHGRTKDRWGFWWTTPTGPGRANSWNCYSPTTTSSQPMTM